MNKEVDEKLDIYKITKSEELLKYYQDWTIKDKYNRVMIDLNYVAPKETVSVLKKYGYSNIDGVDFSQDMLNLIPKGVYKSLDKIDLNKPLKFENNKYDIVICVGTLTYGHVKAHALNEFKRIIKNKGLICFTINEGIYEKYGFDKKIKELNDNKSWEIKEFFKSNYIVNKGVNAWFCLAEING